MGVKGLTPDLDASGMRIAIVVSRYNDDISKRLLRGAMRSLKDRGADQDPDVHWVPGALEIPLVALQLAESSRYDAIVCLGCVVNGETAHFQYVAGECARGVMHVQLDTGVPCAFGVLTTYDREQALARSGEKINKGAEAVEAAVEMVNLLRSIDEDDEREA
jgi:6,7-dimethyl-8-ribityllumazine synthase